MRPYIALDPTTFEINDKLDIAVFQFFLQARRAVPCADRMAESSPFARRHYLLISALEIIRAVPE